MYFVDSFGSFNMLPEKDVTHRFMSYNIDEDQNAVITMQLHADNLTVITNVCPGRLVQAVVTEVFQALSGEGVLKVLALNKGFITCKFTVVCPCRVVFNSGLASCVRCRWNVPRTSCQLPASRKT
jgi:hypothetical protein